MHEVHSPSVSAFSSTSIRSTCCLCSTFGSLILFYHALLVHPLCPRCIKFCNDAKLLDKFRESAKLLDMVQKGLSDYLETKRAGFSRFYFLSNDELLEILSQTKVR